MDFAFSRFERLIARPLGVVPDFPVLLAGLSAMQLGSVTARRQMALNRRDRKESGLVDPLIALLADGVTAPPRDLGASFSMSTAKRVALPS